MPDLVRSALARSASVQNENIFDQQGGAVPVVDSVEDMLSAIGGDTSVIKKKEAPKDADIDYEEYKPRAKKSSSKKKTQKADEPNRPMTEQEKKEKKRRDKIDAQFKKDLAKRGF